MFAFTKLISDTGYMKKILIPVIVLVVLAGVGAGVYFFFFRDSKTPETTPPPATSTTGGPGDYAKFSPFAGEWNGTWTNQTFGSTGDVVLTIVVNDDDTATMTMDVGGLVFGLLDPDPVTLSGTYNTQSMNFTGQSDFFGFFAASVDESNNFTLLAPAVSAPGIDSLDMGGTIDKEAGTLSGTYTIKKENGSSAQGIINFSK